MEFAYVPVGVPTFDLVCAQEQFDASVALMKAVLGNEAVVPSGMLLSLGDLKDFLNSINPDLIVLQNITFANSAYAGEVAASFPHTPILLWTLKEPVIDGKRLRLNSLTGAFSAANVMKNLGIDNFGYVFGSPEDANVKEAIHANAMAVRAKKALSSTTAAAIGHTPQGFGFGRALDSELQKVFGTRLTSIEARELIQRADSYDKDSCSEYLEAFRKACVGVDDVPAVNLDGFVRLFRAYDEFCRENGVGLLASRCWPDFFTSYGTPVCAVLGMLNDRGVVSACESDIYGAVSMYIAYQLSGRASFFGDPVSMDREADTITFWHCGMCAPSLACSADLGVHPNRKIGPVMDFGCRECDRVTIFRIGRTPEGRFRAFIANGSALDAPKQFQGASVVVRTENSAFDIVSKAVLDGWEPHYVVAYADITAELEAFCRILGIAVCRY